MPFSSVLWPREDARDVPRDTPIVVEYTFFGSEPSGLSPPTLVRADGSVVELAEVERLPPAPRSAGAGETIFARPLEPLDPGESYTVSLPAALAQNSSVTFTVGEGMYTSAATPLPDLLYLHVGWPGACTGPYCEVAELRVDLGTPTAEPLWLVVESAAITNGTNQLMFQPAEWTGQGDDLDRTYQFAVALPADDRCVWIGLYGLDGVPLMDEQRCEPDRCALYDRRATPQCPGPAVTGLDPTLIPEGSCEEPPVIDSREGEGPVYPEPPTSMPGYPEPPTSMPNGAVGDHGCAAVGRVRSSDAASCWLLLAGVCWLARSSRRRARRRI